MWVTVPADAQSVGRRHRVDQFTRVASTTTTTAAVAAAATTTALSSGGLLKASTTRWRYFRFDELEE